jgi:hypothetical protein
MKTPAKPGRKKGDAGPRKAPELDPGTMIALAIKRMHIREGFAEAVFGATIHPVLARMVWEARSTREYANTEGCHDQAREWSARAERDLAHVCQIAISRGDAAFFQQLTHCLERIPPGTAHNYPDRALILIAWERSWKDGRPPTAAEVTATANGMTDKLLRVSRVVKEIDKLGLARSGAKN